jgi:xylose isomerase
VGTGLTSEEHRYDRCVTTQFGIFKTEDTHRYRKACVEAKQVAVVGHPSDGESLKTSKTAHEGLVSLVVRKGYFRLSVASI